MGAKRNELSELPNYFNYFTEIEEHFQKARGTSLFLLSPLDWALIESWKNASIPLDAVLRGIDAAFEKWRSRRSKTQQVNSLAFCAQAVLTEAQRAPGSPPEEPDQPFQTGEIEAFLRENLRILQELGSYEEVARALEALLTSSLGDLEDLERNLTVLEQQMIAIARATDPPGVVVEERRELDAQLKPYRSKMTASQLDMLERQFLERKLLERVKLPRLSLFYLR